MYPKNTPKMDVTEKIPQRLTLFKSGTQITTVENRRRFRFSFGLKRELGFKLQKIALNVTLKNAEIDSTTIKKLCRLLNPEEVFIATLLKSEFKSVIPLLYRSPYIAWKLAEAGFETDPRIADSEGFSSLYYAVLTTDVNLLHVLYDYAANGCWGKENCSYRSLDNDVFSNDVVSYLDKLDSVMKTDQTRSKDFAAMRENQRKFSFILQEMLLFNNFLKAVTKTIRGIRSKMNGSTLVSQATKIKETVLSILEIYNNFFVVDEDTSIGEIQTVADINPADETDCADETKEINPLDNYKTFKHFYDNLDFTSALLFFDNIFLLKSKLNLGNIAQYSEIESAFFLSVLSNKYFTTNVKARASIRGRQGSLSQKVNEDKLWLKGNSSNIYVVPCLERFQLREVIKRFIEVLRETDAELWNARERLPKCEVTESLLSFPEIEDELLIARLKHYVKTALCIEVDDVQSVFVIERALQVIGESIKTEGKTAKSYCHLLSACLPSKTASTLRKIRNALSNLNDQEPEIKFNTEKNFDLFSNIQTEIRKINDFFQPVYELQNIRIKEFIFQRSKTLVKAAREESQRLLYLSPMYNYELFNSFLKLETELDDQKAKYSVSFQEFIEKYELLFKNLVHALESKINDPEETKNKILWPLEHLLNFTVEHFQFSNSKRLLEIMKSKNDDVHRTPDHFVKNIKKFICDLYSQENETETDVGNIHRFIQIIAGNIYDYSKEDRDQIMADIPECVKSSKYKLQDSLEKGILLSEEERDAEIKNLILSNKKREKLRKSYKTDSKRALDILKFAIEPISYIQQIFNGESIGGKEFETLCNVIPFSSENKRKLSVAVLGNKQVAAHRDACSNLLDRIHHLKTLVIEANSDIRNLWDNARNWKTKQYTTHKVVQLYMRDPKFQASIETLLFDCMNITRNKRLGCLWKKSSSLFNGINLRNVLAHGSPILENLGQLLDPEDVPSSLVNEILQLIADEDAITAMRDLHRLTKETFGNVMKQDENDEHKELRDRVKICDNWEKYFPLLNGNMKESSSSIGSSISVVSNETQNVS
ncbi:uncharacterized protein LOC118193292 [Stegodyphus dumicola]|uniref:uncharacterized protein LOC118193292 n=1 Tax=Stegodyphus dumicola TaxID=202533 RepID=UPI0015A9AA54|nr:uncharacterized protein LOC118193292 [Stegodyphus dumicola]